MSLLKQIDDRGAVLEWSPLVNQSNLIAIGTKDSSGIGFDEYGGELELHMLDLKNSKSTDSVLLGKATASSRFSSLAWSQMAASTETYPSGLIAGGMVDGFIHIWDPFRLSSGDPEPLVLSVEQHSGAVKGLQFNPHKESSHLLSSGGSDGEVLVMSLERPDQPNVCTPANNSKHSAEVTKVAWNTQVAYILASAAQNGSCFVWDLRQKKAWCELRDPTGGSVADIAWNPDQGLNIVTASGDDKNPVLKLWDLRSSTSLPLATLQGHTEGILSVSWCPTDPSLLLSCGKDSQTMLWDLFHLQPVYNLPSATSGNVNESDEQNVFGGLASSTGQRRYSVQWSPCLPGVASTCSFDRRVQVYSLTGAKSKLGRAPKWLRRPVGAAFGFGGKLATFDSKNVTPSANDAKKHTNTFQIRISQVVEDTEIVASCDQFHNALISGDYKSFCETKSLSASSDRDKEVWGLMKVICFEKNAREELLKFLGFDASEVQALASAYLSQLDETKQDLPSIPKLGFDNDVGVSAADLFGGDGIITPSPPPVSEPTVRQGGSQGSNKIVQEATAEMVAAAIAGNEAEPIIRKAILVGNFALAVDCCLQAGLIAEALILAQCGDQSLWLKTQDVFFSRNLYKRPFLSILNSIIKQDLKTYVQQSDLSNWRETLALVNTYGKTEEFASICEALGNRLEYEGGDSASATLCYMCAANVSRTVAIWIQELNVFVNQKGSMDNQALHQFVEKVVVFTHANPTKDLGRECSAYFAQYGSILAAQGRLDFAAKYLKGDNEPESILIDRLYHAGSKPAGSRPPPFPFTKVVINTVSVASPSQVAAAKPTGAAASVSSMHKAAKAQANVVSHQQASVTSMMANVSISGQTNGQQQQNQQQHQQQPQQQTQQQTQSNVQQYPGATPVTASPSLPTGWLQLVDPASGRPYYVNQATSQSQWEPPAMPLAMPNPMYVPSPTQTPEPKSLMNQQQQQQPSPFTPVNNTQQFQQQQPALGMNNPAQMSQPAVNSNQFAASAPASDPSAVQSSQIVSAVDSEAVAQIGNFINQLSANLNPAEKRQLVMVTQSYGHLCEKVAVNEVSYQILQKLAQLANDLHSRNFNSANAIQTELASSVWAQHKEWLKGLKVLIQLASKK